MTQFSVTVTNAKGFHLRPASKLLQLVTDMGSPKVTLYHADSGRSADCRNMMSLMMMSSPQNTIFTVEVEAEKPEPVREAICELFASGFHDEPPP